MRRYLGPGLVALVLGAAACSGPNDTVGPVVIQAAQPVRQTSPAVTATVTNLSSEVLQVSGCFARIEQRGPGDSWRLVYEETRPCPQELTLVRGYGHHEVEVALPAGLAPSVYRIRLPAVGRQRTEEQEFTVATQLDGEFTLTE